MTDGILLAIYVHERDRSHGLPAFEWLLRQARSLGIGGGSAFRAVAGFGRHGRLHEDRFFELAGDVAVRVEFLATRAQADALLDALRQAGVSFPYVETACRHGMTSG